MANLKISQLASAGSLAGTEVLPIVQGGTTKKVTAQAIADLASGGGSGLSPINIITDGTVASWTQYINYRVSAPITTVSGNQTITPITYPEFYMSGGTATTITVTGIPKAGLQISSFSNLTSVTLPDLTEVMSGGMATLNINSCNLLTSISLPALTILPNNVNINFQNNGLLEASVDNILAKFAATSATNGILYIDGASNRQPSSAGLASIAILVGRGWIINYTINH